MHKRRIARGAAWLDRQDPDWFEKVNPDHLDNLSNSRCVIGQVFGNFDDFMSRRYFIRDVTRKRAYFHPGMYFGFSFMLRHGFDTIRETDNQWREAWRAEIARRVNARKQEEQLFVPTEWATKRMLQQLHQ